MAWFADLDEEEIFLSVLTIGEIPRGIEGTRRRDPDSAAALDGWLASPRRRRSVGRDEEVCAPGYRQVPSTAAAG